MKYNRINIYNSPLYLQLTYVIIHIVIIVGTINMQAAPEEGIIDTP